jgi:hypothetical protein
MAISFASNAGKPNERRRRIRGKVIQVRRTAEDLTQKEFDDVFNGLVENFIRDNEKAAELAELRNKIPFSNKRLNQRYLAGALVLWYQLGKPSYKDLLRIKESVYHKSADRILLSINPNFKESLLEDPVIQLEESTLFRYVSDVAVSLDFVKSI